MKITITTFLLTLFALGGCGEKDQETGKEPEPRVENRGWTLIFVRYDDDTSTATPKDSRFYGMPIMAVFAKDYPFERGKESPKILVAALEYIELQHFPDPSQRGIVLMEFDCDRRLMRDLRMFKLNGSETRPDPTEGWNDIPKDPRGEALLKYACRPRTAPKK